MEKLKLTIQEAQETLLMSQSSVYAWIDKGKLQATETPSGKIVVISKKEAEEIREINLKSKRNKASKQIMQEKEMQSEIPTISAEFLEETQTKNPENINNNITLKLINRLEELALDAGKYKQLEIIRNEEKEKFEFWQSEYFKLNAELQEKNAEISALKKENDELKSHLNKKKTFFGIKFN